jgi:hypothetical protein
MSIRAAPAQPIQHRCILVAELLDANQKLARTFLQLAVTRSSSYPTERKPWPRFQSKSFVPVLLDIQMPESPQRKAIQHLDGPARNIRFSQ